MVLQNGTRSLRKPSFSVGLRHFGKEDFSLESPLKPRLFRVWRRVAISGKSGYCLYPPSCLLNNLSLLFDKREKEIPRTRSEGEVVAVFMTQRLFFSDIFYDILRRCRSIILSNPTTNHIFGIKNGAKITFSEKGLGKPNYYISAGYKAKTPLYPAETIKKSSVSAENRAKLRFGVLSERTLGRDLREGL